jgi:hypothetical protein
VLSWRSSQTLRPAVAVEPAPAMFKLASLGR